MVATMALTAGMLFVTGISIVAVSRDTDIFEPSALAEGVAPAFRQLLASPPIDGYQPAEAALRYDRAAWTSGGGDQQRLLMRYVHDCTRAGDRVLVTGSTPYQVATTSSDPSQAGQLFWHHGWRSDLAHEMQSLALLQKQSVPFALSTHDPVLDDFKSYPRIREYLCKHYAELEGSGGLLLVDTRRRPTERSEPRASRASDRQGTVGSGPRLRPAKRSFPQRSCFTRGSNRSHRSVEIRAGCSSHR